MAKYKVKKSSFESTKKCFEILGHTINNPISKGETVVFEVIKGVNKLSGKQKKLDNQLREILKVNVIPGFVVLLIGVLILISSYQIEILKSYQFTLSCIGIITSAIGLFLSITFLILKGKQKFLIECILTLLSEKSKTKSNK